MFKMLTRVFPLLLLASTWAAEPFPRIFTSKTDINNLIQTSCLLSTSDQPAVAVPVGGKLHVKLYGDCPARASDCVGNQIDNAEYGYPGTAGTTTFNQFGWVSFAPTLSHAGQSYDVCAKTILDDVPSYTCMKVSVKAHRAQFVSVTNLSSPAAADGSVFEAFVGRQLEIPMPVDSLIDGGCDFSGALDYNCEFSTNLAAARGAILCPVLNKDSACTCNSPNPAACQGPCECMTECPLGPLPSVAVIAQDSIPQVPGGLPMGATLSLQPTLLDGAAVTEQTRPQPWAFKWQPMHHDRSLLPYKICFGAIYMGDRGEGSTSIEGERVCYSIRVSKCRQCVKTGDTLVSMAAQHKTDWLHLYYANPSLPGWNPSHIQNDYVLRLGVMYATRWGDDVETLGERFLVPQSSILDQNPELSAPTHVTYMPHAAGVNTQVTITMRARRRLYGLENITVPLPGMLGDDWDGLISLSCEAPITTFQSRTYCFPATHAVDDKCGPGLWGRCENDDSGIMGCRTQRCNGRGQHPLIAAAAWLSATQTLELVVREDLAEGFVEAGQEIRLVVPLSSGLRMPLGRAAATTVHSLLPVPDKIWDPVAEAFTSMKVCVVLPVCQSGVECLYGSDCHLNPQAGAMTQ